MSRATIASGEGWHIYRDDFAGTVHVQLGNEEAGEWEAGPHGVCVRLPAEVLAALQGVSETGPWKMASREELERRGFTFDETGKP